MWVIYPSGLSSYSCENPKGRLLKQILKFHTRVEEEVKRVDAFDMLQPKLPIQGEDGLHGGTYEHSIAGFLNAPTGNRATLIRRVWGNMGSAFLKYSQ